MIAGSIFDQRAFALPFGDVATEKFVNTQHKLFKKHLRQFVSFKGGMKQQSLKLRIVLVMIKCAESQRSKTARSSFSLSASATISSGFIVARARLMIENGGVEFLLGGEMPEDHRFRNAGSLGISLVVVPRKPFREKRLTATRRICSFRSSALMRVVAAAVSTAFLIICSCKWGLPYFAFESAFDVKVSTYLPSAAESCQAHIMFFPASLKVSRDLAR